MTRVKLDHVAFGVPEIDPVAHALVGELGGRERDAGPGAGFVFWQWEFAGGGALEIIVPDGPPGGFLHRFLAARGAGPHHVTFKVADIRAELENARALGYEPVGFDDTWPGWIEAFLHPKQAQGIVVQLAQADASIASDASWKPPPFPAAPPAAEPVRVLGLRLASTSEARARRQWETLLGGSAKQGGDALVFEWPESPLRIAVEVRPDAAEGPLALEVSAERALALPDAAHPALGLPVVQVDA